MPLFTSKSTGADYYLLLERLQSLLQPRTYVEIGIRHGQSFALATTATHCVGIDPAPHIKFPLPPGAKVFSMTSDDFFAAKDLRAELGGSPVDLAFIDGMHLFEFALRDFIHLEKYCAAGSTILVHDCYPIDRETSARDRSTQIWSGDVWKLMVCLKKYRPDLEITTVDAAPTGLGIIRRLDPGSAVLTGALDEICREFVDLDYDRIASDKAAALNRVDNDWKKVRALFPGAAKSGLSGWLTRIGLGGEARSVPRRRSAKLKALGVLLCYNDADILSDSIEALLGNNHDLVVWDHGSDDGTSEVLDRYAGHFRERKLIPRSFDFYRLYEAMSKELMQSYCAEYDWISWPDQDEVLEGPARDRRYFEYLEEAADSPFNWIQFRNFNYWFTSADDPAVVSPTKRIRHYCLFPDCPPRIRAWRASATNIRLFNHNPAKGKQYPTLFNLRHYPMRSRDQMMKRLNEDRADIQREGQNYHYNHMKTQLDRLTIDPERLHADDGKSELNCEIRFDWRSIYKPG